MSTTNQEAKTHVAGELVQTLVHAGSAWARYGLTVGRAALETSARSLELTAQALGRLADAVDPPRGSDEAADAPEGVREQADGPHGGAAAV